MKIPIFKKIFQFYLEGFKSMTVGKKLWAIILIKLFVMFVVLKLFFFPNFLKKNFSSDQERSEYVLEQLISPNK
ncbi:MAG TPA: DUF4492 domain-containing protein [Marinilabiliales bacterium]|nr:DUF4492 domain-containing protein [Salinivirgaceae bacterium]OFX39977.1 MAG: DUF4492 domain-containing protein [Bacteroidetes bacterium GWA2_40_14]OFX61558.1 MAG: DUF4492 domain-containing protein [Bacteroidetes bacterium GWC2_40_13]OFX73566.1 MAG: DUF4492 domain-containing protein [Bacteroidetes bacterium GWD2_40_43]OFX90759.1 MAG: DUF4492 domain-containing protein [Bacteroidetes bacterium GWE2_40_63]OFY20609.1 MAG: DUF4492 domain-containing protein [Bacteroidetes bacterium GWF2_40_13]OFZ